MYTVQRGSNGMSNYKPRILYTYSGAMKWENTYTASTHDHQCDGWIEVFVVNLIEVLNYHFEFTMYNG